MSGSEFIGRLKALDDTDPLRARRADFQIPDSVTYLDGNSLGCLPRSALQRVEQAVVSEWGEGLIRSWLGADWLTLGHRIGDRIGRLVGAAAGQIIACDSTSINLFKALHAALDLVPDRSVILTDEGNFPTDLYIIDSVARMRGCTVRRVRADELPMALNDSVAVVSLTHVDYRRASIYNMAEITHLSQAAGALVIWDLAHSAGAVPCDLDGCAVDFAIGCGYKYLNGGPGAPAFIYVAERHQARIDQPLRGWFGHNTPFAFASRYEPASGIARFQCGTPPIIGLSVLDGALDAFDGVEIATLRAKSDRMVAEFLLLFDRHLLPLGFSLVSERDPERRGSHVSFSHLHGYRIMRALADRGIVGDFRMPDVLRFGFAPLYNSYAEVGLLIAATIDVMTNGDWQRDEYNVRQAVT